MSGYATRQREALEAYLRSLEGEHVSAEGIVEHFADTPEPISRATVYRCLRRLEQDGSVRRYVTDGRRASCFQYLGTHGEASEQARDHFHLQCERCGSLTHIRCQTLSGLGRHIRDGHGFELNPLKTVFYGVCRNCEGRVRLSTLASLVAVMLMLLVVLALGGCTKAGAGSPATGADEGAEGRLSVIATIFAPYDFARQVAGDEADVRMLVPPGAETHSFEPTPQDIIDIEACDVFIYVGGESDEWVDDLLSSVDTSKTTLVRLIDCVPTLEEDDSVLVNPAEAEEEEEEGLPDEHVWTAPANARLITDAIAAALVKADPAHAADFEAHALAYRARLDELDALIATTVAEGKRTTLVFGDRFPFRYLADEYGLTCYAAFPGCSTATEASAQTVAALIDVVNGEGIPVVFYRELSSPKIAETIAEATGARALLLHSCHNISQEDFDAGETYMSIMERNAGNLAIALD
jgi:zinc transport system substrate-binding protein